MNREMRSGSESLAAALSEWADLTEAYRRGMESLRRGEAGASQRMMDLARDMRSFEAQHRAAPALATSDELGPLRDARARPRTRGSLDRALNDLVSGFSRLVAY